MRIAGRLLIGVVAAIVAGCASRPYPVTVQRISDASAANYWSEIQNAVRRHWMPPCLAPEFPAGDTDRGSAVRHVPSGAPVVQFQVRKDGRLGEVRVAQSSGHDGVDTAAIAAVHAAAPFAPIPDELSGAGVTVQASLSFGEGVACRSEKVGVEESAALSPEQHVTAQRLVGRWGRYCGLEILAVDPDGRVRTKTLDGAEIVGRYEARQQRGVTGAVSWRWPARVAHWDVAMTGLGVTGGWLTYLYRPDVDYLHVQNPPYMMAGGSPDTSADRLYRCER